MSEEKRARFSCSQKADIWRRWKAGESLHEIGRALGKAHGSIRFLLLPRGGIPPAARRRSRRALTLGVCVTTSVERRRWVARARSRAWGIGSHPLARGEGFVGWPQARARHRHRRVKLKALATSATSTPTLLRPRSRKPRIPRCSFKIPITGSTSAWRRR